MKMKINFYGTKQNYHKERPKMKLWKNFYKNVLYHSGIVLRCKDTEILKNVDKI